MTLCVSFFLSFFSLLMLLQLSLLFVVFFYRCCCYCCCCMSTSSSLPQDDPERLDKVLKFALRTHIFSFSLSSSSSSNPIPSSFSLPSFLDTRLVRVQGVRVSATSGRGRLGTSLLVPLKRASRKMIVETGRRNKRRALELRGGLQRRAKPVHHPGRSALGGRPDGVNLPDQPLD